MNEIGYCPENKKIYIPEYGEKIWEIDGVNGELKLIVKDLMIGDHQNGGITCKDGYSISRWVFRATPASPIPTTMAGPTSRTIRSGWRIRMVFRRLRTIRRAAMWCIPA